MLRRSSSSDRKLLLTCVITGIVVALLVSSLQFFMSWHQRNAKYDTLTSNIQNYIESFFADLETTTNTLQPLVKDTCSQASAQLTSSAAFSLNVRAFLLVKDGIAFCSSATGSMNTPLQQLVPVLDMTKDIDMDLQPGTPMMPNKPAILIWYRNHSLQNSGVFATLNVNLAPYLLYNARQDDFNGVALIVGKTAITTFSKQLIPVSELPALPSYNAALSTFPLEVRFYADRWTYKDVGYAIMLGCMAGIMTALLLWYYIYSIRLRPGKDILNAIKHNQFYVVYQCQGSIEMSVIQLN